MKIALADPNNLAEKSLFLIDGKLLESVKQSIEPEESREQQKLHKDSDGIGLKRRELKSKFFSAGGVSDDISSGVSD